MDPFVSRGKPCEILLTWPEGVGAPAKLMLWMWLQRLVQECQVLCDGDGTRKEPHFYRLAGMELKVAGEVRR
jgi:hypothetical protein